jgi:hypothetical protein
VNPSDAGNEDMKYHCELCDPRTVDRVSSKEGVKRTLLTKLGLRYLNSVRRHKTSKD